MKPFDFYIIRKVNKKKICHYCLNLVCGVSVAVCLMVNERDDALFPKIFKLKSSLNCCLLLAWRLEVVCQGRRPSILTCPTRHSSLHTYTSIQKALREKRQQKWDNMKETLDGRTELMVVVATVQMISSLSSFGIHGEVYFSTW